MSLSDDQGSQSGSLTAEHVVLEGAVMKCRHCGVANPLPGGFMGAFLLRGVLNFFWEEHAKCPKQEGKP